MKTLLARWIASRLDIRARALRRSLRDYQRREYAEIRVLEERCGLRLYAAWVRNNTMSTREMPEAWALAQLSAAGFH